MDKGLLEEQIEKIVQAEIAKWLANQHHFVQGECPCGLTLDAWQIDESTFVPNSRDGEPNA